MTCAQYDQMIAMLTQQIAAQNSLIDAQTGVVALDYVDCCVDDTLPGGPMPPPITDAAILSRIGQLYMFFMNPQLVAQAQKAVNDYYALKQAFDTLTSMQGQLAMLQQQLSMVVAAKAADPQCGGSQQLVKRKKGR